MLCWRTIGARISSSSSSRPSLLQRRVVVRRDGVIPRVGGRPCWLSSSSYPPHEVVGLPSLSPTMESGSIAVWKLNVGDSFGPGEAYCSVETDKATMEFEAQDDGIVAKILVEANSGDIAVGTPIMITVTDPSHVSAFANYHVTADGAAASPPPSTPAEPVVPKVVQETAAPAVAAAVAKGPTPSLVSAGVVVASPLARMLAHEKGYDIATMIGTGPGGRIVAADVKEYVPTMAAATPSTRAASSSSVASPATTIGSASAVVGSSGGTADDWASYSKQNVPHYYLTVDIRVDALQKLRETKAWSDNEISLHACLIKAAAMSMSSVPACNAAYLGDVIRYYKNVDLQIVGDDDHNLVVKNCAALGIKTIETIVNADADPQPTTDDGTTGTFSFCNLGMYGIASCAPIIRPPQACALAVGTIETVLVPSSTLNNDGIPYETIARFTATLSCDHRVVDGAVGAQWLATFKNYVENPTTLLL